MATSHAATAAVGKTANVTSSYSTTSSAELDLPDGPTLINSSEFPSRQKQDERIDIHKPAMLQRQESFPTSSISTSSSSSTIPGVGMISGRFIKRVGQAIIHFAEEPIIWRRLSAIRRQFENEVLRIELLSDAKSLFSVLFDLSELRVVKSGHSVTGYPKRIVSAALILTQQIMDYIWTASDKSWITDKMANSILFCFCALYWSHEDSEMRLHVVKQIFKLLDSRKEIDLREQKFLEQGTRVLCDFAASCPCYLLRSDSSSTVKRAFEILSQMKPVVISFDVHCSTLEIGYHNLMLTLKQWDVRYEGAFLENTLLAFEPLTTEQYDIHITSLLCACISRLTERLRLEFDLAGHWLRYPFEMYDVVLPLKEVLVPINMAFIDALIKDITEISDSINTIAVKEDHKQQRARRDMVALLKRLAQSTRSREQGPLHFQLGSCMGVGRIGTVYRALDLTMGQTVAIKRIDLTGLSEGEIQQHLKEVDMVTSLSHPNIVKYEGLTRDHDTLNIVLEYAENGSLEQTLKAFGKLNERLAANYVVKILEGLHYLHSRDVVHCELKASNILTTNNGNIKLSDFGVSFNLRKDKESGTPNWMAPEVIELKGATKASDIWSLGCVVIELVTGKPPYSEMTNGMSVMFRSVEDQMPPLPVICSDVLKDFLRLCFQKDPTKRPTALMLCEHEWLKRNWGLHRELRPQDTNRLMEHCTRRHRH